MGFGVLENNRLVGCYHAIRRCTVNSNFGENDFEELENLINDAQPKDDTERAQYQVVRLFYRANPNEFNGYINSTTLVIKAFVLWTDVINIMRHFDLKYKAFLIWNPQTSACSVVKFVPHHKRVARDDTYASKVGSKVEETKVTEENKETNEETNEETKGVNEETDTKESTNETELKSETPVEKPKQEKHNKNVMKYDNWAEKKFSHNQGNKSKKGLEYSAHKYRQQNKMSTPKFAKDTKE